MDIKVNQIQQTTQVEQTTQVNQPDPTFKFTLASHIAETELQTRLQGLMQAISEEGEKLAKRKDLRDLKHYRALVKEFLNEIVSRSHSFTRENFLDRRGRHRVFGIIRLVDEEKDNLRILSAIGEIRGLLLDIFT